MLILAWASFFLVLLIVVGVWLLIRADARNEIPEGEVETKLAAALETELFGASEGRWPQ